MEQQNDKKDLTPKAGSTIIFRLGLATLIILLVIIYTWAVISGYIPENRKIDLVNLAVIAFGIVVGLVIMTPGLFNRLKMFQISSFKLEMLEKVKERQAEQESRLDDIALILPLLLPKTDRKHLLNIADGNTMDYKGSHSLRSELRRLRSAGLIKSKPQTHISQMKDDIVQDVSMLVELTTLGSRWANRIREIEQVEKNNL